MVIQRNHNDNDKNEKKVDDLEAQFMSMPMPCSDDPDLFDPACDPENPQRVSWEEIVRAAAAIEGGVVKTPCELSPLSASLGVTLYTKKEFLQYTGSFKERGARYSLQCLVAEGAKQRGVVAASAGNHAQALAYHGALLGVPVAVVMPKNAPLVKVANCRRLGATVVVRGANMTEAKLLALKIAAKTGRRYVNGYDDVRILAGQGTVGLEVLAQVQDGAVDAVLVPVGGGGLIAGVAVAVKQLCPNVAIIGVESKSCPAFSASLRARCVVPTAPVLPTLGDGLAVPCVGGNSLQSVLTDNGSSLVDKMVTVSEDYTALAVMRLLETERGLVEGSGAVGVAALMQGLLPELAGKRVVCLLTGGNIDTPQLLSCIERGQTMLHRLSSFSVALPTSSAPPLLLHRFCSDRNITIKSIQIDLHGESINLMAVSDMVVYTVAVETHDLEHEYAIKKEINAYFPTAVFH